MALHDNSAEVARRVLQRGVQNLTTLLKHVGGSGEFTYVACPDLSITLRERRLILGLPIGGYINWTGTKIFPLELDVNSCGVHMVKPLGQFDLDSFRTRMKDLKRKMDDQEIVVDGITLKWNFARRNHFINVYKGQAGAHYVIFHSSGETVLFDWQGLHSRFNVRTCRIDKRDVPYICGEDVDTYWAIAERENEFFFRRHQRVFRELFGEEFQIVYADRHFGMVNEYELLMGCSKVPVGTRFPILTKPFAEVYLAEAKEPDVAILNITGGHTLVPHGLGMTIPDSIRDIQPDPIMPGYVVIQHSNGCRMITNTLEHIGISHRSPDVLPKMSQLGHFSILEELTPLLCLKV